MRNVERDYPTLVRHPRPKLAPEKTAYHFCDKVGHQTCVLFCMLRKHPESTALVHTQILPANVHTVYDQTCARCDIWPIVNGLVTIEKSISGVVHNDEKGKRKVSRKV